MAYWHMTNKVKRHPDIAEDESVLAACYGLSASFTSAGNAAAGFVSNSARDKISNPIAEGPFNADFEGTEGLASPLTKTGVLALTNRRLIYFEKLFAIGRPKKIICTWPLEQVTEVEYIKRGNVLLIRFSDGSTGGLHVPPAQKPSRFLEAFENLTV